MAKKLIFVADDERMITQLLAYAFAKRGTYSVKIFSCGEDVLEALHLVPDAVVLDQVFHCNLTGLDTLKAIKQKNNGISVVMLTSETEPSLMHDFYKHGATKYIHKSGMFIDEVVTTIERVLKRK